MAIELKPTLHEIIELNMITLSQTNPRTYFNKEVMAELTDSIRRHGVLQPILVRPMKHGGYEVVAGHRRYLASLDAGCIEIPATVRELSDIEALEIQVIENLQRADLHPLEEAEGYRQLIAHGYSAEDLALKVGKSKGYIYARLKLSSLPEPAKKAFWEGILNPSVALLIARIPDPTLAEKAAAEILNGKQNWHDESEPMSYRQALRLIREDYMLRLTEASFNIEDPDLLPAAGPCKLCQQRTGNQMELFADIGSADVCTNPPCYKDKIKIYGDHLIEGAKQKGQKVLSAKEAEKLFSQYGQDQLNYSVPYVKLSDSCDLDSKRRTWEKLLKKHAPAGVVARNPHTGNVHTLLDRREAAAALKAAGLTVVAHYPDGVEDSKKQRRDQEAKTKLRQAVFADAMGRIVELSEASDLRSDFLRVLAQALIGSAWSDTIRLIAKRRQVKEEKSKGAGRGDVIEKSITVMSPEQLRGLVVELILARSAPGSYQEQQNKTFKEACRLHDIDLKEIEGRLKAEKKRKKEKKS